MALFRAGKRREERLSESSLPAESHWSILHHWPSSRQISGRPSTAYHIAALRAPCLREVCQEW
eukprot:4484860-Alexandrium_andersonii.AAC.1